jgi:hypothetical protein
LKFDEAEAFLAVISVSAFTKLLVDEIAKQLNYSAVQKDISHGKVQRNLLVSQPLIFQVTSTLANFPKYHRQHVTSAPIESEAQLMGALAAFLTSFVPDARTTTGRVLQGTKPSYVDMMVESGDETVLIELKRGDSPSLLERGLNQLSDYLSAAGSKYGILFLYSEKSTDYEVTILPASRPGSEIHVVRASERSVIAD